jgi:hypothetical protein
VYHKRQYTSHTLCEKEVGQYNGFRKSRENDLKRRSTLSAIKSIRNVSVMKLGSGKRMKIMTGN